MLALTFPKRSLFFKFAVPTVVCFMLGITAMAIIVPRLIRQNMIESAVASARETVFQFKTVRGYYSNNVVRKLAGKDGIEFSSSHQQANQLPLPATVILDLSKLLSDRGTTLTLYSPFPFPNRADRKLDKFQKAAWVYLQKHPDGIYTKMVNTNGTHIARVALPDIMSAQSCVSCHNEHSDSLKRDWQLGDVGGVLEVNSNVSTEIASAMRTGRWVVLAMIALALMVMGCAYYVFKKCVTNPLARANTVAKRISEGDLSASIGDIPHDEVGELLTSLSTMQGKLTNILGDMRGGPDAIANGLREVSDGVEHLSERTQGQAASLEQTAASMEQITATVKQNSENAGQANQLAMRTCEQAEHGGSVVSEAVSAMTDINQSSQKVSEIIGVINEIAFQTNLLALNAAVEAARAGDQGRGFAVVATEVRNLAQRSADAAQEIKNLIQDSSDKVETGSALVNRSGETLKEIMESVKKVSDIVGEITSASNEQSAGIEQVNTAVTQMDQATQQNATLVGQTAAATRSMSAQAKVLSERLGYFQFAKHSTERAPGVSDTEGD